jgi:CBS-domain-containing membrane protein
MPELQLRSLVTYSPQAARRESCLADLLDLMERFSFHHVPVVDDECRVLGIVSDRDVVAAMLLHLAALVPVGAEPAAPPAQFARSCTAGDIMSQPVLAIEEPATAAGALRLLLERGLHCLPVVRDERTLTGILTSTDFLRALCQDDWTCCRDLVSRHMVGCGLQVDVSTSPHVAAQLMDEFDLRCLVVTCSGRAVGIAAQRTLRAYIRRLWRQECTGLDLVAGATGGLEETVGQLIDPLAEAVRPGDTVQTAASRMLQLGLQALPVLDERQELVGLVREEELLAAFAAELG